MRILFSFCLVILLTSCIASETERRTIAAKIALEAGFTPTVISGSQFDIMSYTRFSDPKTPLTIYIEGDGLSWISRTSPSSNPTPTEPLALKLAALDRSANVAYLARPCQYVDLSNSRFCHQDYWTHKRFAPEIMESMNFAVETVKRQSGSEKIHLVGYSGGGTVAPLLAARRDDVASLRTVAGYLDHVELNRKRGFSPLTGSLDPMQIANKLHTLPQMHYVGDDDTTIPTWVAKRFINAQDKHFGKHCAHVHPVDATHTKGWEHFWRHEWQSLPTCY